MYKILSYVEKKEINVYDDKQPLLQYGKLEWVIAIFIVSPAQTTVLAHRKASQKKQRME